LTSHHSDEALTRDVRKVMGVVMKIVEKFRGTWVRRTAATFAASLALPGPVGVAAGAAQAQEAAAPASPDPSTWVCKKCPFPTGHDGSAELGAGYLSDGSAAFGPGPGLDEKGADVGPGPAPEVGLLPAFLTEAAAGDPVFAELPPADPIGDVVVERLHADLELKRPARELRVLRLGFLEADDVGRFGREPREQARQSHVERIDVPGGELHAPLAQVPASCADTSPAR